MFYTSLKCGDHEFNNMVNIRSVTDTVLLELIKMPNLGQLQFYFCDRHATVMHK